MYPQNYENNHRIRIDASTKKFYCIGKLKQTTRLENLIFLLYVLASMHFTWLLYFSSSFQSFESIRKGKKHTSKANRCEADRWACCFKKFKTIHIWDKTYGSNSVQRIFEVWNYGFEIEQKMLSCCLKPQNVFKLGHFLRTKVVQRICSLCRRQLTWTCS